VGEKAALVADNPSSWAQLGSQAKKFLLQKTSGRRDMKSYLQLLIAVTMVGWVGAGMASETSALSQRLVEWLI